MPGSRRQRPGAAIPRVRWFGFRVAHLLHGHEESVTWPHLPQARLTSMIGVVFPTAFGTMRRRVLPHRAHPPTTKSMPQPKHFIRMGASLMLRQTIFSLPTSMTVGEVISPDAGKIWRHRSCSPCFPPDSIFTSTRRIPFAPSPDLVSLAFMVCLSADVSFMGTG